MEVMATSLGLPLRDTGSIPVGSTNPGTNRSACHRAEFGFWPVMTRAVNMHINMKEFFHSPMPELKDSPSQMRGIDVDFEIAALRLSADHGGSSRLYYLGNDRVVKESLEPVRDKEAALEKVRRTRNNIKVIKRYLGDTFLETHCLLKKDAQGKDRVYFVQKRAPKEGKSLNPDAWDMKFGEKARKNLSELIVSIEQMYVDTQMMIDLLALSNFIYDQEQESFYFVDPDPLICDPENEQKLSAEYSVGSQIEGRFLTYNQTASTLSAIDANREHLELLKTLLNAHNY